MSNNIECDATSQGQSMFCASCGLQWDLNDPDPPQCMQENLSKHEINKRLKELKERM